MTGAYLRVKRDDKWENIEVEYLTDEERTAIFKDRSVEELIRWLNTVCSAVPDYCPTCEGSGKVPRFVQEPESRFFGQLVCSACNGTGLYLVTEKAS